MYQLLDAYSAALGSCMQQCKLHSTTGEAAPKQGELIHNALPATAAAASKKQFMTKADR
jgi:hypothetical protein